MYCSLLVSFKYSSMGTVAWKKAGLVIEKVAELSWFRLLRSILKINSLFDVDV